MALKTLMSSRLQQRASQPHDSQKHHKGNNLPTGVHSSPTAISSYFGRTQRRTKTKPKIKPNIIRKIPITFARTPVTGLSLLDNWIPSGVNAFLPKPINMAAIIRKKKSIKSTMNYELLGLNLSGKKIRPHFTLYYFSSGKPPFINIDFTYFVARSSEADSHRGRGAEQGPTSNMPQAEPLVRTPALAVIRTRAPLSKWSINWSWLPGIGAKRGIGIMIIGTIPAQATRLL
jgi:hypothetical protein